MKVGEEEVGRLANIWATVNGMLHLCSRRIYCLEGQGKKWNILPVW